VFDCVPVSFWATISGQVPEPIPANFPWLSLSILFPIAGSLVGIDRSIKNIYFELEDREQLSAK